jgi:SNF2 family DNA or RNA helicase
LQQYCRHVVHYDLEWNPAKLEQREGRVDRKGRKTDGPVNVYFLLCSGTYDERARRR